MENKDNILSITTIFVTIVSLLGNVIQFIISPKKPKTEQEYDVSQTLSKITEAYDKLFENLKERIVILEEEAVSNKKLIGELEGIKAELTKKIADQDVQIQLLTRKLAYLEGKRTKGDK